MADAAWCRTSREDLGLTQAELAAALHVTQATVSRIESGDQTLTARTRSQIEDLVERRRLTPAVAESP